MKPRSVLPPGSSVGLSLFPWLFLSPKKSKQTHVTVALVGTVYTSPRQTSILMAGGLEDTARLQMKGVLPSDSVDT